MNKKDTILVAENVTKRFDDLLVVYNISLSCEKNELLAIQGHQAQEINASKSLKWP